MMFNKIKQMIQKAITIKSKRNSVSINDTVVVENAQSINMVNGEIYIDGNHVTVNSKVINLTILGNIDTLETRNCETVTVNGSAGSVSNSNGKVVITGDVTGNVNNSNGNINCGNVQGSVKTSNGNITRR